jgi:hypothetical protein
VGTYEVMMVILAIVTALMGVASKFFWNKLGSYDKQHENVRREVREIDDRLSARMNKVESRATTLESTIVTKDDLFNLVNTLREDGVRRDDRIYDKLESLAAKVEALLYERAKHNKRSTDYQE